LRRETLRATARVPIHPRPYHDDDEGEGERSFIVGAGAVWSGEGTLAVALVPIPPCKNWTRNPDVETR
jgi:hypothetical protein